jgi:hypothetical protein
MTVERQHHGEPLGSAEVTNLQAGKEKTRYKKAERLMSEVAESIMITDAMADILEKSGDEKGIRAAKLLREAIVDRETAAMEENTISSRMKATWEHPITVKNVVIFGLGVLSGYVAYSVLAYFMQWAGGIFGQQITDETLEAAAPAARRRLAAA